MNINFRSKQLILTTYVWLLHKRLIQERNESLFVRKSLSLQEALFEELWEDCTNRIRGEGIAELSVNKYLKQVQTESLQLCLELDQVIRLNLPPEKLLEEFAGVLWRTIFNKDEQVDEHLVEEMAKYFVNEHFSL